MVSQSYTVLDIRKKYVNFMDEHGQECYILCGVFTAMPLILLIVSCLSDEQHTQKAALEQAFDDACEENVQIGKDLKLFDQNCKTLHPDFSDEACEEAKQQKQITKSVAALRMNQIVKDRDALGIWSPEPIRWICHSVTDPAVTMSGLTREND